MKLKLTDSSLQNSTFFYVTAANFSSNHMKDFRVSSENPEAFTLYRGVKTFKIMNSNQIGHAIHFVSELSNSSTLKSEPLLLIYWKLLNTVFVLCAFIRICCLIVTLHNEMSHSLVFFNFLKIQILHTCKPVIPVYEWLSQKNNYFCSMKLNV